jgi:hypothetical protein
MPSPSPLLARLAAEVVEVHLAQGAVVVPVVTHPAVDHRAFRRGGLQRRVRVEQGHGHRPAVVGRADHADVAVRFLDVLHQPVDGVPGVGGVVGLVGLSGPIGGRVMMYLPSEPYLPRMSCQTRMVLPSAQSLSPDHTASAMCGLLSGREAVGVVWRALEQHRQAVRALRDQQHGVQLHAVAHRDHHLALDVVEVALRLLPVGRNVRRGLDHVGRDLRTIGTQCGRSGQGN